jgi:flavin-dependent dehydrogenase
MSQPAGYAATEGIHLRCDVLIAGAGLAGGSLALRLARRGVYVIVLEAQRFPRDKLCGEYLSPEGCQVLEDLGLSVVENGIDAAPIRVLRLSTPRGTLIESRLVGDDGRPALGVSRATLDDYLADAAEQAGADILSPVRATHPCCESRRVVGVWARDAGNLPLLIRAPVTVAADGRHSALVRTAGSIRVMTPGRPGHFGLKCHFEGGTAADEAEEAVALHLVRGGYVGTCRIEGRRNNLCGLLEEAELQRDRGDLDRLSDRIFADNPNLWRMWEERRTIGPWKTVAAVRVQSTTARLPGIFFAGDSQGTIDPLGGQGMTMALLSARLLEPYVLEALRRGHATTELQRGYERAWHSRFDRRIQLCRAFHLALMHPAALDAVGRWRHGAGRLLAALYRITRDGPVSSRRCDGSGGR